MSLRITGNWAVKTNITGLLASGGLCSASFFLKINSFTANYEGRLFGQGPFRTFVGSDFAGPPNVLQLKWGSNSELNYSLHYQFGTVYHIGMVWNATGVCSIYVNGVAVQSVNAPGGNVGDASSNFLEIGFYNEVASTTDYQISDFAIWNNYALTLSDVDAIRDRILTPLQVGSGTLAFYTMNGTLGANVLFSDIGLQDSGNSGVNFTSLATGTTGNAVYGSSLIYTPPASVIPYVCKSGSLVNFFATVASNGSLSNITAIATDPTIQVQFGGSGPLHTVAKWGPLWSPDTHQLPFASYQIACGAVKEIVVQNGGHNYSSSPSASVTSGNCTLGTPVVSGGVTSVVVTNGGSDYTSQPFIEFFGNGYGALATATIVGGVITAVTIFAPGYGYSGSPFVAFEGGGGSNAAGTSIVSNVIISIPVLSGGSNYTSPPTITITDSTGSNAVAAPQMNGVGPSDIVTYTNVPDGWIVTEVGTAPAVPSIYVSSNIVANYSGQLEPGIGGYSGFDLPAVNQRTLRVGYDIADPHSNYAYNYNAYVNWLKRALIGVGVHNVVSITPDNRPLTLAGDTSFDICDPTNNGIDFSNWPVADGVWTFIADDTNAAKPMVADLGVYHGGATITKVYTPGITTTGVNAVTLIAGGSSYTDVPTVIITDSTGTGAKAYVQINSSGSVIGIYLTAVGSNYSSPTITISGGGGSSATATASIGSVISGSVWQFTVTRTSSVDLDLGINIAFSNPAQSGTYPYTLVNEYLFSPATSAAAAPGIPIRKGGPDQSLINWMTTSSGNGPFVLRYVDSTLGFAGTPTNCVDASDLKDSNDWSWDTRYPLTGDDLIANPTGCRHFNIITIRTYGISTTGYPSGWNMTWSSPNLYLPEAGLIGTPVPSWAGYGHGLAGPFVMQPTSIGYINFAGGQWFALEAVTDVPHNLKTGQKIQYVTHTGSQYFTISTDNSGGTAQAAIDAVGLIPDIYVYVTGPTTFAISGFGGSPCDGTGQPGGICNVAGSFAVNYVFSMQVPEAATIPYDVTAQITSNFLDTNHYVNIPPAATDACCAAIARRIRDNFPMGRKVYVEYGNENWNLGFPMAFFTNAMGNLGVWTSASVGQIPAYTARAAQHHQTFINVFNQPDINGNTNRGSEIVRFFAGQFSFPGGTLQQMMNYVNANSIPMDVYAVADYRPYLDQGYPNPSMRLAAAALASGWPTSIAYGTTMPWTRAMYVEYFRHILKYDSTLNGPNSYFAQNIAVLNTYITPSGKGQPPGYKPLLAGYEGGLDAVVPGVQTGPDPHGFYLTSQLAHDIFYEPELRNAEIAHYESAQKGGMSWISLFHLAGGWYGGGGNPQPFWSSVLWSGQPVGLGDGSIASNGQAITNKYWVGTQKAQHLVNTTVRLKGFNDWITQTVTRPWFIQTPGTSIAQQRSKCSISCFIKFNSFTPSYTGNIFGAGLNQIFIGQQFSPNPNFIPLCFGAGYPLYYNFNFQFGTIYHIAMVWNSTGVSSIYINASSVQSVTSSVLSTTGTGDSLKVGFYNKSNSTIDYQISDLSIHNDYSFTSVDVTALRDRTKTPLQIGTGTISWWSLSGTLGGIPLASDTAFQDLGNSGLNFTSFSSVPASAVYAGPLIFS